MCGGLCKVGCTRSVMQSEFCEVSYARWVM